MNPRFAATSAPIRLFRNPKSGHCHRVELMLALLDIPYETVDLDMANGAHKAPEFLKISPFGQVPAIEDNGVFLSDSNAILVYLTQRYDGEQRFMPSDALAAAEVQRWLSVAAGEIAAGPCTARLVTVFGAPLTTAGHRSRTCPVRRHGVPSRTASLPGGGAPHLGRHRGLQLHRPCPGRWCQPELYPAIRGWLARIEAEPDFVGMATSPVMA
ncbi:glutathione S-transferase [Cobetia marina]